MLLGFKRALLCADCERELYIELPGEDAPFHRPDWLGTEVTDDPAYYNAAMALD